MSWDGALQNFGGNNFSCHTQAQNVKIPRNRHTNPEKHLESSIFLVLPIFGFKWEVWFPPRVLGSLHSLLYSNGRKEPPHLAEKVRGYE